MLVIIMVGGWPQKYIVYIILNLFLIMFVQKLSKAVQSKIYIIFWH